MICVSRSIARAYAERALSVRDAKPWFKGRRDKRDSRPCESLILIGRRAEVDGKTGDLRNADIARVDAISSALWLDRPFRQRRSGRLPASPAPV